MRYEVSLRARVAASDKPVGVLCAGTEVLLSVFSVPGSSPLKKDWPLVVLAPKQENSMHAGFAIPPKAVAEVNLKEESGELAISYFVNSIVPANLLSSMKTAEDRPACAEGSSTLGKAVFKVASAAYPAIAKLIL